MLKARGKRFDKYLEAFAARFTIIRYSSEAGLCLAPCSFLKCRLALRTDNDQKIRWHESLEGNRQVRAAACPNLHSTIKKCTISALIWADEFVS